MRRLAAASLFLLLMVPAVAPFPAAARDALLHMQIDGRPVDSKTPSGVLHGGIAYVNVVRITKAYSGLLTFGKADHSVNVTIRGKSATFWVGRRQGDFNGDETTYAGAPFVLNGDVYVPLAAIAQLAGSTLFVDTKHHTARLNSQS